jgi:hypothetical protein
MKNKLFLGLAVLLIAGITFTACKNDIMDVRIVPDKANAVASVTATLTTDKTAVILTWDAVDNVSSYSLRYRMIDTKTVESLSGGSYVQNEYTYAVANGASSQNTDPDKWSTLVTLSSAGLTAGKSYEFGVRTSVLVGNADSSDIVWSNAIAVPTP